MERKNLHKFRLTYTWTENGLRKEDSIVIQAPHHKSALEIALDRLPLYNEHPGVQLFSIGPA